MTAKENSVYRLVAGYHLESDVFIPWGSGQPVGPGIEVHLCALLSGMDSCPAWLLSLPPRPTTLPQDMLSGLLVQVRSLCGIRPRSQLVSSRP